MNEMSKIKQQFNLSQNRLGQYFNQEPLEC
jgi:hypothetical protein